MPSGAVVSGLGLPGANPRRRASARALAQSCRSLDELERALTTGVSAYEPGLLAAAHRGVLYVDEVNLLHDHLVDLLLDAAALGTSYVEREGVTVRHAARFLLVGTMNPEEGELRPQLLDRFGLTVEVAATREPVVSSPRLRAELRDYQRHGLTWLAEMTGLGLGACLADDMGLGKTVTLIALHLHRHDVGHDHGSAAPGGVHRPRLPSAPWPTSTMRPPRPCCPRPSRR